MRPNRFFRQAVFDRYGAGRTPSAALLVVLPPNYFPEAAGWRGRAAPALIITPAKVALGAERPGHIRDIAGEIGKVLFAF